MKIQFSLKRQNNFVLYLIWAIKQLTSTFGLYCKNINFWGHFVKTQKSTTSCNYNRTQNLINAKTSLKDQNNLSFSVFGPKRKNVNFWAKVQIHKSIKTLCNCIKPPKVLPLEGGPVLEKD